MAIAAGRTHQIALKRDGTVVGNGTYYVSGGGEAPVVIPPAVTNVVAIAAGCEHDLAFKRDGTVVAWGSYAHPPPPGLSGVVGLAAGCGQSLALWWDGTVFAWAHPNLPFFPPPPGLSNVVAVAADYYHFLALRRDGTVVAWGNNDYGQANVPADVTNAVAIAAGTYHSLALRSDGTVVGWGRNDAGQATAPAGFSNAVAVSASYRDSIALTGDGSPVITVQPVDQAGFTGTPASFSVMAVGVPPLSYQWQFHGTNLADARNSVIELDEIQPALAGPYRVLVSNALGTVTSSEVVLTPIETVPRFLVQPTNQTVCYSETVTFRVAADGSRPFRYQWRLDDTDIAGANTDTLIVECARLHQAGRYSVAVSNPYGVVISSNASLTVLPVLSWGSSAPRDLTNAISIAAGGLHILALRDDQTVVAWGNGNFGLTDVPSGLTQVVAIAAGLYHSVAVRDDGTVVAWGQTPPPPSDLNQVQAVAGGAGHSIALRLDGTAVAWGDNSYGRTNVPPRLTDIVQVGAGHYHSLVLKSDGTVVAWGYNAHRETDVPFGLTNVVAIAGGGYHSLALRDNGTVVAWGYNHEGQTDVPANLADVVAISAGISHSLALRADGTVVTWGATASPPTCLTNVVAIAAGPDTALFSEQPVFVTMNPSSRAVDIGHRATFRVVAGGAPPLNYQWRRNGTDIPGATNSFLTIEDVQAKDSGAYTVVVGNSLGATASRPAWLTPIARPPMIMGDLTNQVAHLGGTVTFQTEGTGPLPIFYQWRLNGEEIPGATNCALGLSHLATSQAGDYLVVVSNQFGVAVSSTARLSVVPVAAWGANGNGQTTLVPTLTNVVAVAAGGEHNLALRADGTVVAWGLNHRGQTTVPPGLANVTAVAAGDAFSVALRWDGKLVAWGFNNAGQTNVPAAATGIVGIAAGASQVVALRRDGTVLGWGANTWGQVSIPNGLSNVVALAAGFAYSLALKANGTVAFWGYYGDGGTPPPPGLSNVVAIAGGGHHSLALSIDGTVKAWGWNGCGQTIVPEGLSNVVAVAAGGNHSLALRSDGTVVMWGDNTSGQTNLPGELPPVAALAGGYAHSLALLGEVPAFLVSHPVSQTLFKGATVTFGVTTLGSGTLDYQWQCNGVDIPGATYPNLTITNAQSSAHNGSYRVLISNAWGTATSADAVLTVVPVAAWGGNQYGQASLSPEFALDTMQIACGASHSLGVKRHGTVVAWGYNGSGQCSVPAHLSNVVAVAAGDAHSLALKSEGTVVGWGDDYYGQTRAPSDLTNAVAIAACRFHSLALRADGTVVHWGRNLYGEGNLPPGLNRVIAIASGQRHSLALCGDGRVVAWGDNARGQISVPSGLAQVVAIAAGGFHGLALRRDATVVAWGSDSAGESRVPPGLTNIVGIAGSSAGSFAIRTDGSVVAWGDNRYGQTNVPPELGRVMAVAAGSSHCLALIGEGPPITLKDPMNLTALAGESIVLSAAAFGEWPLSYFWRKDADPWAGALAHSMLLSGVGRDDTGRYSLVVSNAFGTAVTRDATLTVRVPQRLLRLERLADGSVRVCSSYVDGAPLALEDVAHFEAFVSSDLAQWTLVTNSLSVDDGLLLLHDTGITGHAQRFYRVVEK